MLLKKPSLLQKIGMIFVGIFIFFLMIEGALRLNTFLFSSIQYSENKIIPEEEGIYKILFLGDSMGLWGGEDSFPRQLEEILNNKTIEKRFQVINRCISGGTSTSIIAQLDENLNRYKPDLVAVMMGVVDEREAAVYSTAYLQDRAEWMKKWQIKNFKFSKLITYLMIDYFIQIKKRRFEKEEMELRVSIQKRPSEELFLKLGRSLKKQGKYSEAEMALKDVLMLNPENKTAAFILAVLYEDQGKFKKEERALREMILKWPFFEKPYLLLHRFYRERQRYQEAEEVFKEAIRETSSFWAYVFLANYYCGIKEYAKATRFFEKALENSENAWLYAEFGKCFMSQSEYRKAEVMFIKSLKIDYNGRTSLELGLCYKALKDYEKSEAMMLKALEYDGKDWGYAGPSLEVGSPKIDVVYSELSSLYKEMNKTEAAERISKEMKIDLTLEKNFVVFHERVMQKVGRVAYVQYPLLSVLKLKRMVPGGEGISFVDNESVFKKAVQEDGYNEYFLDRHGGNFGHCTRKGNKILAENIAQVILRSLKIKYGP